MIEISVHCVIQCGEHLRTLLLS